MSLKKDLKEPDIYDVLKICDAKKLGDRLEKEWAKEYTKKHPSLFKALYRMFGFEYFIIGLNQLVVKSIVM